VRRLGLSLSGVAVALVTVGPADAQTYRFQASDGTTHYTNAPTDARYQRTGFASGTAAGWLRLSGPGPALYVQEIRQSAERYGVPESLVTAVIRAESGFDPRAVSRKGARGLMQLMPSTANTLGVRDSFNPQQNIDGGVRHLRGLIERFGSNLSLAVAAYNAGEGAVARYGGIPPYPETQEYVARVMRLYGSDAGAVATRTYQRVGADGTITYTNIPPHGRR
jgi:soluble lytic murein transglycosylase-like protein